MTDDPDLRPLATVRVAYEGAQCRKCRASVIWVETANGNRLAVDLRPTLDGRIELRRTVGAALVAVQHGAPPPDGHVRYRVHVASCKPPVRGWRGRR